jgi:hypothetical protein
MGKGRCQPRRDESDETSWPVPPIRSKNVWAERDVALAGARVEKENGWSPAA